jgi:hypothetical protein
MPWLLVPAFRTAFPGLEHDLSNHFRGPRQGTSSCEKQYALRNIGRTSISDMTMIASSKSKVGEDIDSSRAECTAPSAPLYRLSPNWVMALSWRLIPKYVVASLDVGVRSQYMSHVQFVDEDDLRKE